jgi:hypothetical protein
MTNIIRLHHLALCSTLAMLGSSCLLKVEGLDAGLDEDDSAAEQPTTGEEAEEGDGDGDENSNDPLECLIGTEPNAIGVAQSMWDPQCEVLCADGWGHDGEQLPIAWTLSVTTPNPGTAYQAQALGLIENGDVVVAVDLDEGLELQFFDPDSQMGYGGYEVEGIGSTVFGAEVDGNTLYVTHSDELGAIELSVIDIASQQELWDISATGTWASAPSGGGGKVAFILTDEQIPSQEFFVVGPDEQALNNVIAFDHATSVAISSSGSRFAIAGDVTRVYSLETGDWLDEFTHDSFAALFPNAMAFVGEDRLVTAGAGFEHDRFEGWLSGDSLAGDDEWERVYNRATAWCPEPEDDQWSAATAEWLVGVAVLADDSLIVVGSEQYEGGGESGSHPWVAHISADGELLARDRGLWDGHAKDVIAGPDGSAYVVVADNIPPEGSQGFRLRKYTPDFGAP